VVCSDDAETIATEAAQLVTLSETVDVKDREPTDIAPFTLITTLDPKGVLWTRDKPSRMVRSRLVTLAQASLDVLNRCFQPQPLGQLLNSAFIPALNDFDLVISLDSNAMAAQGLVTSGYKNIKSTPLIGFNPMRAFLTQLEDRFGHAMVFFTGSQHLSGAPPPAIAAAFRPATCLPQPFRVGNSREITLLTPTAHNAGKQKKPKSQSEAVEVIPDFACIFLQIRRLGEGLVSSVELPSGARVLP